MYSKRGFSCAFHTIASPSVIKVYSIPIYSGFSSLFYVNKTKFLFLGFLSLYKLFTDAVDRIAKSSKIIPYYHDVKKGPNTLGGQNHNYTRIDRVVLS